MRLAGRLARRAFDVLFENRGKIRGITEPAALGHLRHVQPRIQQCTLGKLHALLNQVLLQRDSRRLAEDPA